MWNFPKYRTLQAFDPHWSEVMTTMPNLRRKGSGMNVYLCCDDGRKVGLHEFIARRFTRVFDLVGAGAQKAARDPYGNYVFIMTGVQYDTLRGLSELLYTGETTLLSRQNKEDMLDLLEDSLVSQLTKPTTAIKSYEKGRKRQMCRPDNHLLTADVNGNRGKKAKICEQQFVWADDVMVVAAPKPKQPSRMKKKKVAPQVKCEPMFTWSEVMTSITKPKQRTATNQKKKMPRVKIETPPPPPLSLLPVVRLEKLDLSIRNISRGRAVKKEPSLTANVMAKVVKRAVVKMGLRVDDDRVLSSKQQRAMKHDLFLCPICYAMMANKSDVKAHLVEVHRLPDTFGLPPVRASLSTQAGLARPKKHLQP